MSSSYHGVVTLTVDFGAYCIMPPLLHLRPRPVWAVYLPVMAMVQRCVASH